MLYWICPECGHECSPAIRECPTCTVPPVPPQEAEQPAPEQTVASDELLSLAQNFRPMPPAVLVAAEPQRQQQLSANGHESSDAITAVAIADEPVEKVSKDPEASKTLVSLGKLAIRPAGPAQQTAAKLPPVAVPVGIGSPAMATPSARTRSQSGLKAAEAAQAGEVVFQAANFADSAAAPRTSEPLPSGRRSVAFVRAELPGADCDGMVLAELAPLAPPVPRSDTEQTNGATTPLGCELSTPRLVPSGLKPADESLAGLLDALRISAEEIDRAGIQAIHNSFVEQSGVSLLSAPAEVVTAPAPAGAQCLRSEKPKFTPVEPENRGRAAVIAGPQTPTLAGPSLPPQLLNFDHQSSKLHQRRSRWSTWPLSLLVIMLIIVAVVSALQYLTQDRDTRAAASTTAPAMVQATKPAPAPRLPVVEEHPAARSVEVAGIRIVNGPNKKPQLQFIVINHSAKELTGLNIHVAVHSVNAPADTPLLSVSSLVSALGPNQSKEIRTEVNASIQPSQIPDWQSLRADILIGRQ